jgi:hypothetical protein
MDPALLAMLMEWIMSRQASGGHDPAQAGGSQSFAMPGNTGGPGPSYGPPSGPPAGVPPPSFAPPPTRELRTLPPQASPQAFTSTGRAPWLAHPGQASAPRAVQAAQRIASAAGPNPPMQQSFPKPASQRPQSPAPKPALADFTAPRPARLDKPPVRYQSSGFSKPSTRR